MFGDDFQNIFPATWQEMMVPARDKSRGRKINVKRPGIEKDKLGW